MEYSQETEQSSNAMALAGKQLWFSKLEVGDAEIRHRFGSMVQGALPVRLDHEETTSETCEFLLTWITRCVTVR